MNDLGAMDRRRLIGQLLQRQSRPLERIGPRDPDAPIPLTLEQQHVWFEINNQKDVPLYNEAITIHVRGPFDHDIFVASFREILKRHEIWRTSFSTRSDQTFQIVHSDVEISFPLVDVSHLDPNDREKQAQHLAWCDAVEPFDLDRAPLMRGKLLRFSETEHRLYLTLSHIIFDGVTIYQILVPELQQTYARMTGKDVPPLAPATLQYGDYAVWQARAEGTGRFERQLDYWRQALSGDLPLTELPYDRPRTTHRNHHGGMETFELDQELLARLKTLARRENVTLYMLLLAGFKTLIHRYGGQRDIVVGGVTDTRRREELQGLMGYFLNSLAFRTYPDPQQTFSAYLRQVRDVVLAGLDASDVPFQQVVQALGIRPDPSGHPVFQVFFSMEPPAPIFAEGWELTQMDVSVGGAKFDLYLELDERADGSMAARFLYAADMFEAETVRHMITHWRKVLEEIVRDPDQLLAEIAYLPVNEQWQSALIAGRDFEIEDTSIDRLVSRVAKGAPNAVAIACGKQVMRYADLDVLSDAVAAGLARAGVSPGDLVAVCLPRSITLPVLLLGVLKVGAAYLPLDPSFPRERLSLILSDARPKLLLAEQNLSDRLPAWTGPSFFGTDLLDPDYAQGGTPPGGKPRDLAYVIYTSGSTGIPKGVEIEHRSVVNLLNAMRARPGFTSRDRLLAVTTISFDISVLEIFLPLISGGCVEIVPEPQIADPRQLARVIDRSACTVVQATPAMWRGLLANGWRGKPGLKIWCGGEALPGDLAERLVAADMDLWNMYGPTETTIWSSVARIGAPGQISIGDPVDNTQFLVLDETQHPVFRNLSGELYIGGSGLARGYRDPELTTEKFVSIDGVDGARFYKTGDIVRRRAGGAIEWLSRSDNQLKLRGFRIETGDIEAALCSYPDIAAAAVMGLPGTDGDIVLTAFVVARHGVPALSSSILNPYLREKLPSYMVPAKIVAVQALPATANGKIDRKALAHLDSEKDLSRERVWIPPKGEMQLRLAGLFEELLHVERVGATDDFFDLGGHSLIAVQLLSRISREFGVDLPLGILLTAATVDRLAAQIAAREEAAVHQSIVPLHSGAGATPPLFWIDALPNFRPGKFRSLAASLGGGRPMLGLPLDFPDDPMLERSSVEQLAERLADTVLASRPSGTFSVGGYCNGGVIAYELARQLKERGADLDLLILFDTTNPALRPSPLDNFLYRLRQINATTPDQRGALTHALIAEYFVRIQQQFLLGTGEATAMLRLNKRFVGIVNCDVPSRYDGPVMLLQSEDGRDAHQGWQELLASNLAVTDVQGRHVAAFRSPLVTSLAERLDDCLSRGTDQSSPRGA